MKHFLMGLLCSLFGFAAVNAQAVPSSFEIDIWQDIVTADTTLHAQMIASLPAADKATGRAVLILPGGGYSGLAVGHEGTEWASFFNERGIAAFVLKYRMPRGQHEIPLQDVRQALALIRSKAQAWHINPNGVGIMGSSAGGHLAASAATLLLSTERPAFQILFYPVISMERGITHQGSRNNLLGSRQTPALVHRYSLDRQVTSATPKAFITLSSDDKVVIPQNSIDYYMALTRAGVPASMHIYPTGDHGWGIRANFAHNKEMLNSLSNWLKE